MRKVSGAVGLAVRNLVCYKSATVKIAAAFTALIMIASLFSMFIISAEQEREEMKEGYFSANYVISGKEFADGAEYAEFAFSADYIDFAPVSEELLGTEFSFLPAYRVGLRIEENLYTCGDTLQGIFVYAISDPAGFITKNDLAESGEPGIDSFVEGRLPKSGDEVAVAEYMLEEYGITRSPVGKKVSMVSLAGGNTVWEELTVCGVIGNAYYELAGHRDGMSHFAPSVLIHESNEMLAAYPHERKYVYTLSQWPDHGDALLQDEDILYAGWGYLEDIRVLDNVGEMIRQVFLYVGTALMTGIILIALLLVNRLSERMRANGEILFALGATRLFYLSLRLIQTALLVLLSLAAALVLSVAVFAALGKIIAVCFGVGFELVAAHFGVIAAAGAALLLLASAGTGVTLFLRGRERRR